MGAAVPAHSSDEAAAAEEQGGVVAHGDITQV